MYFHFEIAYKCCIVVFVPVIDSLEKSGRNESFEDMENQKDKNNQVCFTAYIFSLYTQRD